MSNSEKPQEMNIEELKIQFRGEPFGKLIKYYVQKQSLKQLNDALQQTRDLLPQSVQSLTHKFIYRWDKQALDRGLWQVDTSEILVKIMEDARLILSSSGAPTEDETLYNLFQIVVLNFAHTASNHPDMYKFDSK